MNVTQRMQIGASLMLLAKFLERGLGLISTVILARLLLPGDFGLVAMAAPIVMFIELLRSFSFDMALIQKADAEAAHFDTAWTLNLLSTTLIALLMVLAAAPAADFYQEPRFAPVMAWLALGTFIQGFENIGTVSFRKELDFGQEFRLLLYKKLASITLTALLALWLRDYWALVWGTLVSRVFGVALSYHMSHYRPSLRLSHWRDLMHFSKWMVVNNLLFFLNLRGVDFVIARLFGAAVLGQYLVAIEISTILSVELVAAANRAFFPGFVKLSGEPNTVVRHCTTVMAAAAMWLLPLAMLLYLLGDLLVHAMFGDKWPLTGELIGEFGLFGALTAFTGSLSYAYMAVGHPRFSSVAAAVQSLIVLVLLVVNGYWGRPEWIGHCFVLTACLVLFVHAAMVKHVFPALQLLRWLRGVARMSLAAVGAGLIISRLKAPLLGSGLPEPVVLVGLGIGGVALYGAGVWLLWRLDHCKDGPERSILTRIPRLQAYIERRRSPYDWIAEGRI